MSIGQLTAGVRGVDCNRPLSGSDATAFLAKGFQFAVRYVRRTQQHAYDLTASETADILSAGMGLMVVQHVAPPGWLPTGDDGALYGNTAARESITAGLRLGSTVWCDLEGVEHGTPAGDVVEFCNEWHDAVAALGFSPGLYVGDSCVLSPNELYSLLRFESYWSAYNLNSDAVPAVRGVQMKQHVAQRADFIAGFDNQNMDVDVLCGDALGGLPVLTLP